MGLLDFDLSIVCYREAQHMRYVRRPFDGGRCLVIHDPSDHPPMTANSVNPNLPPDTQPTRAVRKGTKRHAVLRTLYERGRRGLDCFAAVELCRDFVLRTTIADLQRELGIRIDREPFTFVNTHGGHTTAARYWLNPADRARVAFLLGLSA